MSNKVLGLLLTILCGVMVLAGLVTLSRAVHGHMKARRAEGWPTVEGKIISSELQTFGSGTRAQCTPRVLYQYTVDGTVHSSEQIGVIGVAGSWRQSDAKATVERYSPGATVTVHYHPDDPDWAVLETSDPGKFWVLLLTGTVCLIVGAAVLYVLYLKAGVPSTGGTRP